VSAVSAVADKSDTAEGRSVANPIIQSSNDPTI
jgi:hypothetical protein